MGGGQLRMPVHKLGNWLIAVTTATLTGLHLENANIAEIDRLLQSRDIF